MYKHREHLLKAIMIIGNQTLLAKILGVYASLVNNWLNRDQEVPAHYAMRIEILTKGAVKSEDLCPSLSSDLSGIARMSMRLKHVEHEVDDIKEAIVRLTHVGHEVDDIKEKIQKIYLYIVGKESETLSASS